MSRTPTGESRTDWRRYREVSRLFLGIALHILWWDVFLNRPALRRFRKPPLPRWRKLAVYFRNRAVELGGVLIKLGQFMGARVDLLPPEITHELSGLQDHVPPASADAVIAQIESDFGRPLAELFSSFESEPIGAASLGQVHRARLLNGQAVVVKVLRPGIERIVDADLHAISKSIRRLRYFKALRRRVDLDVLAREFSTVTRRELNCVAEGRNAERFAADFASNPGIYVPKIHWEYTKAHTLTMEDVAYFPIDDVAGFESAGISRTRVGERLVDSYLVQIFRTYFVHADPHAGNLFVKPLPHPTDFRGNRPFAPSEKVAYVPDRAFQLVYVDFGMAIEVPPGVRSSMRTYAIGLGTRDAHMIVQSYVEGDLLLPGTDPDEVERMTAALLERFPSTFIGQIRGGDFQQYIELFSEYRVLIYNSPLRFQADLLFVFRAMGVLSGVVAEIAPDLDPAARLLPLAQQLIMEDWMPDSGRMKRLAKLCMQWPKRFDEFLTQLENRPWRAGADSATQYRLAMEASVRASNRLMLAVVVTGLMLCLSIWGSRLFPVTSHGRDASGPGPTENAGRPHRADVGAGHARPADRYEAVRQ